MVRGLLKKTCFYFITNCFVYFILKINTNDFIVKVMKSRSSSTAAKQFIVPVSLSVYKYPRKTVFLCIEKIVAQV